MVSFCQYTSQHRNIPLDFPFRWVWLWRTVKYFYQLVRFEMYCCCFWLVRFFLNWRLPSHHRFGAHVRLHWKMIRSILLLYYFIPRHVCVYVHSSVYFGLFLCWRIRKIRVSERGGIIQMYGSKLAQFKAAYGLALTHLLLVIQFVTR